MKINDVGTTRAPSYAAQRRGERPAAAAPSAARADRATLSPEAQALLRAQQAGETAEGRAALVEQLRRQVQEGTYQVDDHALAKRIAQRWQADSADAG
jgi:flagellar biosynthesis anti-sigma factor FlgM